MAIVGVNDCDWFGWDFSVPLTDHNRMTTGAVVAALLTLNSQRPMGPILRAYLRSLLALNVCAATRPLCAKKKKRGYKKTL